MHREEGDGEVISLLGVAPETSHASVTSLQARRVVASNLILKSKASRVYLKLAPRARICINS